MNIFPKSALLLAALSSLLTWSLCRWWYRKHLRRLMSQVEALRERPRGFGQMIDTHRVRAWDGSADEFESTFFADPPPTATSTAPRRPPRRLPATRFGPRAIRSARLADDAPPHQKLAFLDTVASTRHANGPHDLS